MIKIGFWRVLYGALGAIGATAYGTEPPAKQAAPMARSDAAAFVGEEAISLQDLDAKVLKTNMKLAQSLYDARRAALDQVLWERLLSAEATAKGVTVDNLARQRITEKAKPVTDADVEAYFKTNQARMGGRTLEQVSGQIRSQLVSQRENEARSEILSQLKEKAGVRIVLAPPRADFVVAANEPAKGSPSAKVTILEYSDFQ